MRLFGKRDDIEKKESRVARSVSQVMGFNSIFRTSDDFLELARAGYIGNAFIRRSVDLIANAARSIPLVAKYEDGTPAPESELQKLLDVYGGGFTGRVFSYLMLSGNSYIEVVKTSSGLPVELFVLRPDMMKKTVDGTFVFKKDSNKKVLFQPDEIVHTMLFNPLSELEGASPLLAARRALDSHNAANDWSTAMLQNQAAPSGILTAEGYLSDEDYERLKKEMRESWTGSKNAGLPKLLDNGLTWTPISYSPKDLSWLEGKQDAALEIVTALGVPPELVGLGNTTYSNREQAAISFYSETVKPLMEHYTYDLSNQLASQFEEGMYVDADYSAVPALRESEELKLKKLVALSDVLTINERRALYGYEPVESGDVILVSSGSAPISEE